MLNRAIELAIVLQDGKEFPLGPSKRSSWTRVPRFASAGNPLPSSNDSKGKEVKQLHMIKTAASNKRKVSAMAERAFNPSMLTSQQWDKAMKEGLCYACLGQHCFKDCPKKSKITASMVVNPVQEAEDSEEDLLDDADQHYPQRILAISVTKKVSSVPDAVLSPVAQQGYQFPDTELIVLKGYVQQQPIKILFDTG